jgi:hypothetical protein
VLEPLPTALTPKTISLKLKFDRALELSPMNIECPMSFNVPPVISYLPDKSPIDKLKLPFVNSPIAPLPTITFLWSMVIKFKSSLHI